MGRPPIRSLREYTGCCSPNTACKEGESGTGHIHNKQFGVAYVESTSVDDDITSDSASSDPGGCNPAWRVVEVAALPTAIKRGE